MNITTTGFFDCVERVFHDWRYGHPRILYSLIRSLKPQFVIEVGTYRGYGAAYMARALQENGAGHLFCIDNFSLTDHCARYGDARRHLRENLSVLNVSDVVTIIDGDSDKVQWPARCDFAYIDGWHSYLAAKHDFERCAALGAACIALDDTTQSVGPRLFVDELRRTAEWNVVDILGDCGLSICTRAKQTKGPITFSQELPMHPGVDLQTLNAEQQRQHFDRCAKITGVDYSPILSNICPPIK